MPGNNLSLYLHVRRRACAGSPEPSLLAFAKYVAGQIGDFYGGPNGVMTLKPRLCVCVCVCVWGGVMSHQQLRSYGDGSYPQDTSTAPRLFS